jgi:hypothetical protein
MSFEAEARADAALSEREDRRLFSSFLKLRLLPDAEITTEEEVEEETRLDDAGVKIEDKLLLLLLLSFPTEAKSVSSSSLSS